MFLVRQHQNNQIPAAAFPLISTSHRNGSSFYAQTIAPTGRKAAGSCCGCVWPALPSGSSLMFVPLPTVRPEKYQAPSAGACKGEKHLCRRAEAFKTEPGGDCCGVRSWHTKCSHAEDLLGSLQDPCQL